ncbi:Uncharacterised protein [Mycobacteroides abscessus subsp. abscessus]|nr:Uncharacterised protein [Mycobacteroides abscessus subsp. abscessus]
MPLVTLTSTRSDDPLGVNVAVPTVSPLMSLSSAVADSLDEFGMPSASSTDPGGA